MLNKYLSLWLRHTEYRIMKPFVVAIDCDWVAVLQDLQQHAMNMLQEPVQVPIWAVMITGVVTMTTWCVMRRNKAIQKADIGQDGEESRRERLRRPNLGNYAPPREPLITGQVHNNMGVFPTTKPPPPRCPVTSPTSTTPIVKRNLMTTPPLASPPRTFNQRPSAGSKPRPPIPPNMTQEEANRILQQYEQWGKPMPVKPSSPHFPMGLPAPAEASRPQEVAEEPEIAETTPTVTNLETMTADVEPNVEDTMVMGQTAVHCWAPELDYRLVRGNPKVKDLGVEHCHHDWKSGMKSSHGFTVTCKQCGRKIYQGWSLTEKTARSLTDLRPLVKLTWVGISQEARAHPPYPFD